MGEVVERSRGKSIIVYPEIIPDRAKTSRDIRESIAHLPSKQRAVVVLRAAGFKLSEIVPLFGVSAKTLKRWVKRIYEK